MEDEPKILDYSHKKLDEVPQEVVDHGRMLEELYLDSNDIELLPKGIFNLPKLKVLSVCDNNLCEFSKFLGNLDCVERIDISKNCISEFPDSIENCMKLVQLDASVNPIVGLPDGLLNLSSLTHLILNETFLEFLPENIGELSQLKVLELRQNRLSLLPKSARNLQQLERLDIGNNKFNDLPVATGYMTNLQELLADGNAIEEVPPVIGLLRNLYLLDLSMNKLEYLPPEIESMESLTDLYLSANELLELPENIGSLRNLETLKLDENDLLFLPPSIGSLENLEELDANTNNLEGVPCTVGQLSRLKVLNLDNNCIKSLPDEVGSCTSLSLLSLRSNNLACVPASLGRLQNLHMINLSSNMLSFLPVTFFDLTNLKALWLCENQSKPVVLLERTFNEKEKKHVASCYLLPQNAWDEDKCEHVEQNISIVVEEVEAHENESVRTRGSISQFLISRNRSDDDHMASCEDNHVTPWYEQEFIESVDDSEVFSDKEEDANKNEAEEGIYSCSTLKGSLNSRHSFREELPSSLQDTSLHTCRAIQHTSVSSLGNVDTNEIVHSSNKGPSHSSLSCITQDPSPNPSDAGGVSLNRKSLVDAEGKHGNTSAIISAAEYLQFKDNTAEQDTVLITSDEEEMPLRFNNKRHRNGNPKGTYEAFKPTRFNLYTNSDEPSWSTIKRNNSLESSSPTIKKKSVTAKLNPLIGARLARDESPPAARYQGGAENKKYTVTQKYEDKIRALQQQRQKERSRRRNHSNRVDYNVENHDVTLDVSPSSHAEFCRYHNPTASLPAPSYYLISDEGDSVAIQLGDFVLGSQQVKNEKKKKGKNKQNDKRVSSPPVAASFVQQQRRHTPATPSHYLYNTENRPTVCKQNGVLQNLESQRKILDSYANKRYESSPGGQTRDEKEITSNQNNEYYSPNKKNEQNDNKNQLHKHHASHHDFTSSERGRDRDVRRDSPRPELLNHRASSPSVQQFSEQVENGLLSNRSRTTDRQFGRKLQPTPNGTVQHVTVRSGEIARPLSPRLEIEDDRHCDLTFKQFSSNCKTEDVASFLVKNVSNEMEKSSVMHEMSINCDVEDAARNISKHSLDFSEEKKELLVTNLDAPDAACPLSKHGDVTGRGHHAKDKRLQILKLSSGPTEQIEIRVYRNPGLGFTIGGGVNSGSQVEGIYVVSVNPEGPSSHLLRSGDRILEVNKFNLRNVSHEHAVLFLTHNQQLDLLIERVVQ